MTDGDHLMPFELGSDRLPGFALGACAREVRVGCDTGVANPTGLAPALHSSPGMVADFTVTVDVGPVPSGGATLPVRRESPHVADLADLAAGSAGTLPRVCASEFDGNMPCLTGVVTIPASPTAQEVPVPVNAGFPDDGRATLFLGRHPVVIGHTP